MLRLSIAAFLTLIAFASNSVLNRMAVAGDHISVGDFAIWRVAAGAVTLIIISLIIRRSRVFEIIKQNISFRILGGLSLATYMLGFSLAYLKLDAGLGTLLLFGSVQLTMFTASIMMKEVLTLRRVVGAIVALLGLIWLLLPEGKISLPIGAISAMVIAGIGWGCYSLLGRKATDPIPETALNFCVAFIICVTVIILFPMPDPKLADQTGLLLAIISGAITSGCGYSLWYTILPHLGASRAGLAQLSVPPLAIFGGIILLNETLTLHLVLASLVVIGGVAYGLTNSRKPKH